MVCQPNDYAFHDDPRLCPALTTFFFFRPESVAGRPELTQLYVGMAAPPKRSVSPYYGL